MQVEPLTEAETDALPKWVAKLPELDHVSGIYTQSAMATVIGKTDATVRQIIKAIQQHVPRTALINDKGITELGKELILRSQERGDLSMPRWTSQLGRYVLRLPNAAKWHGPEESNDVEQHRSIQESQERAGELAVASKQLRSQIRGRLARSYGNRDRAAESQSELLAQEAYNRKLEQLAAEFEAEQKAVEDFERMKREIGA